MSVSAPASPPPASAVDGASTFAAPAPPSLSMGVIGNCAFSALVDARARIVWCCLPRFDADPVFNALLDPSENGSAFAIEIENF